MSDSTKVTVKKGDLEATLTIHSRLIYDSDLTNIHHFIHSVHGFLDYSQRKGDRPKQEVLEVLESKPSSEGSDE